MNINKVIVAGRLTRDPEVKALPSGVQVASFAVATGRKYKDKEGNEQEETEFVNCVAFAKRAEVIGKYFAKGSRIYLEGRMKTRSWEKDGHKNYRTEVIVDQFQFVDTKAESKVQAGGQQDAPEHSDEDINPDDIPF